MIQTVSVRDGREAVNRPVQSSVAIRYGTWAWPVGSVSLSAASAETAETKIRFKSTVTRANMHTSIIVEVFKYPIHRPSSPEIVLSLSCVRYARSYAVFFTVISRQILVITQTQTVVESTASCMCIVYKVIRRKH